jgi:hypothetical protein
MPWNLECGMQLGDPGRMPDDANKRNRRKKKLDAHITHQDKKMGFGFAFWEDAYVAAYMAVAIWI